MYPLRRRNLRQRSRITGSPVCRAGSHRDRLFYLAQWRGEGLNFAIAVDEVKKFLARKGDRSVQESIVSKKETSCEPKQVSGWRDKENASNVFSYDTNCSGKINAEYIVPDKPSDPVMLRVDRNADGRADVMYFDFKRRGKWDLSFWHENYDGHWTLVGYHPDGSLIPSRFESYEAFQRRRQAER